MAFFFQHKLESKLIPFLEGEEIRKSQKNMPIYFEVDYALNICKQREQELQNELTKLKLVHQRSQNTSEEGKAEITRISDKIQVQRKAQIIIYAILSHYDKAVKIALECHDVEMAKQYANKPEDKKIKKKLWMKIAKYLFNYQGKKNRAASPSLVPGAKRLGISEALEILRDSKLKIDDLLPLFPADEKVQDMKEHLCDCLNDYHNKIQSLKKELGDHSNNAEQLRKQQRKQKHKHITINPSQMCDLCFKPIFDKEFYVFPCHHAFHRQCIQQKLENYRTKDVEVSAVLEKLKGCFN